jgi:RNA-directed DNA polymerase
MSVADALALAALDGEWAEDGVAVRLAEALGRKRGPWARSLARALCAAPPLPPDALALVIARHPGSAKVRSKAIVRRWFTPPLAMRPSRFEAPSITSVPELAAMLEVPLAHLEWLADVRGMNQRAKKPELSHYHYRVVQKRSGGVRLLEAPKPTLKRAQRRLLDRVLVHCPVHACAMGFARGRSVRDHAAAHVGRRVVVRFDLENFFWQIDARRVRGIFRALGYPSPIDRMLAGLATTLTPSAVRREASSRLALAERHTFRALLTGRHLPQGAPSSPALANLCAFALDRRIAGLAARFGARYTRYADDLAFSGERDFERALDRFMPSVAAIALAEGFRVRHHKTRVMRSGARQELCGVVVNRRPSLRRAEIERLEATLFNCVRSGPETQNRDRHPDFRAHLRGRIEWLAQLAPQRAAPLHELFARIEW